MRRHISAGVLALASLLLIFIFPAWAFSLVMTALISAGIYEFFHICKINGIGGYKSIGIIAGTLLPLATFFLFDYAVPNEPLLLLFFIGSLFLFQFSRKSKNDAIVIKIAVTLFAVVYIGWLFSFMIKLRLLEQGKWLVGYLFLVVKGGDVGAFLIGRRFGRHRFLPHISPRKSIEGALGGLLFSVLIGLFASSFLHGRGVGSFMLIALILGIFAQFGDFTESAIKRGCNVKDSSSAIPGLGGVLDTIDSLLFAAPVFYYFVRFL